jgi:hypothetical protein
MIAFCDIIFQIVKDHSFSFLLLVQVARFDHFSQTSRIIVVLRLILIIARNPSKKKITTITYLLVRRDYSESNAIQR